MTETQPTAERWTHAELLLRAAELVAAWPAGVPMDGASQAAILMAAKRMARYIEATVRADDDEAIGYDWLCGLGFINFTGGGTHESLKPMRLGESLSVWQTPKDSTVLGWAIFAGSKHTQVHLPMTACPQTRGQLRALCRALGISLQ